MSPLNPLELLAAAVRLALAMRQDDVNDNPYVNVKKLYSNRLWDEEQHLTDLELLKAATQVIATQSSADQPSANRSVARKPPAKSAVRDVMRGVFAKAPTNKNVMYTEVRKVLPNVSRSVVRAIYEEPEFKDSRPKRGRKPKI